MCEKSVKLIDEIIAKRSKILQAISRKVLSHRSTNLNYLRDAKYHQLLDEQRYRQGELLGLRKARSALLTEDS